MSLQAQKREFANLQICKFALKAQLISAQRQRLGYNLMTPRKGRFFIPPVAHIKSMPQRGDVRRTEGLFQSLNRRCQELRTLTSLLSLSFHNLSASPDLTALTPSPRGTSADEPTGSKVVEIYFNNYSDSIFQHIPQGFRLSFFVVLSGSFSI
jgi:hypothetical protein